MCKTFRVSSNPCIEFEVAPAAAPASGFFTKLLGDTGFEGEAAKAIAKLDSKPFGKLLLNNIRILAQAHGITIKVEKVSSHGGQEGSGWDPESHVVRWYPGNFNPPTTDYPDDEYGYDQLVGIPSFIILGHELCHALHTLNRSTDYGEGRLGNNAIEEARTIGLGIFNSDDEPNENNLRKEHGLPLRKTFQGSTWQRISKGTKFA